MNKTGGSVLAIAMTVVVLSACADSAMAPSPSPQDSLRTRESIAFSFRGNIYAVAPDGSGLQRLVGPDNASYSSPAFSPGGQRLAYIADRKRLVVTDAGDMNNILSDIDLYLDQTPPTPIASDFSMGPVAVHWSPDGTMLLVTRQRLGGSGASDVLVMNADGTDQQTVLVAGLFIEATWWQPEDGPPLVLVIGADATFNAITYDLDGAVVGRGLPTTATRSAVASLQHPDGASVLIRSTLGSPGPFEPIEVEDADGPRIVAGGCGATWSPDGDLIAFYNGDGIVMKEPDAPPDDVIMIVTNADLELEEPPQLQSDGVSTSSCSGLGISWSANASVADVGESVSLTPLSYRSYRDDDLGIEFDLPDSWSPGAAPMPYFSCFTCRILGPTGAAPPYGVKIYVVNDLSNSNCADFPSCEGRGSVFSANRTFPDGVDLETTVGGYGAFQRRSMVQPPLGLFNTTGEVRLYHQVSTAVDTPIGEDLMIVGFYREDDEVGEVAVEAAYVALLESLVVVE